MFIEDKEPPLPFLQRNTEWVLRRVLPWSPCWALVSDKPIFKECWCHSCHFWDRWQERRDPPGRRTMIYYPGLGQRSPNHPVCFQTSYWELTRCLIYFNCKLQNQKCLDHLFVFFRYPADSLSHGMCQYLFYELSDTIWNNLRIPSTDPPLL